MAKLTGKYESIIVYDLRKGEEGIEALKAKFAKLLGDNATVESVDEWGKRRLAYPINDIPEGYYVVVNFKSEADFPAELERIFNIDESIMRSVIVKIDPKKVAAKEAAVAAEETANEEETAADAE